MPKVNTIFRLPAESKADLQKWADREGISLSQLLVILTTGKGPRAVAGKVLSQHAANELARLSMPNMSPLLIQGNERLSNAFSDLIFSTSVIHFEQCLGNIDRVEELEEHRAKAEANFYRVYGEEVKLKEMEISN